jgi:hypothetical protein
VHNTLAFGNHAITMEHPQAVVDEEIGERQHHQPRRVGRRRAEVDPQVEVFLRSSMLRFTRIIQERNRYQAQVQELQARVRAMDTERMNLVANFERVNSSCQASNLTRNARS